jgi:hypothetical protein
VSSIPENTNGSRDHETLTPRLNGAGGAAESPDLSDVQPPPGPPPKHQSQADERDSEGYSKPPTFDDPISLAQAEAAAASGAGNDNENHPFKLQIKQEPIQEEDTTEAQQAVAKVANTLRSPVFSSTLATPQRKVGTVRGRRDVRNTMYVPTNTSIDVGEPQRSPATAASEGSVGSPASGSFSGGRAAALAALGGEGSNADTNSIRSSSSVGVAHIQHPVMTNPGLNASIIETVNAVFEENVLSRVSVAGEVALAYSGAEDATQRGKLC